ncbi:hypothetical protein Scep_019723 [Stephania cephalantha]|uniref:Uncharacterized protein n=1 Tax=Stephania cephalantha TaxID=152367 RepID=A0AAP0IB74_9MAGN
MKSEMIGYHYIVNPDQLRKFFKLPKGKFEYYNTHHFAHVKGFDQGTVLCQICKKPPRYISKRLKTHQLMMLGRLLHILITRSITPRTGNFPSITRFDLFLMWRMNPSILTSEEGYVFESDCNHILGKSNLLLMGLTLIPKMGTWVDKDGNSISSEEDNQEDGNQDEGDVNGEEVKVRDHVERESSREGVAIDDHVVGDPSEEDVMDRSEREKTMGTPLEAAPIEHEHEPIGTPLEAAQMEHGTRGEEIMGDAAPLKQPPFEQPSTGVFMEAQFNQVENMLREQSHIAKSIDQLDKKVKKLTDVLTKSAGDASYGLNLLHGDMEINLICA